MGSRRDRRQLQDVGVARRDPFSIHRHAALSR
jgi:hypothetical protein